MDLRSWLSALGGSPAGAAAYGMAAPPVPSQQPMGLAVPPMARGTKLSAEMDYDGSHPRQQEQAARDHFRSYGPNMLMDALIPGYGAGGDAKAASEAFGEGRYGAAALNAGLAAADFLPFLGALPAAARAWKSAPHLADYSKVNKDVLDPVGYQNVKLDKPLSEIEVDSEDLGNLLPRQATRIEDLEGSVILPLYGDRSSTEQMVRGVDGMTFDQPVRTEGGVDFMVGPAAQADSAIWASKSNIITRLQQRALQEAEATGRPIIGATISMSPDAVDFTNFGAATMAEMVKLSPITKGAAKAFDADMKKVDPNWPGVLSNDLRVYVEKAKPDIRKQFIRSMDTAPAQKAGFPSPAKMRLAVTDKSQRNIRAGQVGAAMGRFDVGASPVRDPSVPHSTYDTQMTGQYLGGMPLLPQGDVFRDLYRGMEGSVTKGGQQFSEAHKTYAMKTKIPGQTLDAELVDYLMRLQESQR